ncbi:MAG TPA: hypothetical protein VLK27_13010 [Chthoniobacterales bacterium]|nr:hypothetical protein [Chthoniobacterales bacterium]
MLRPTSKIIAILALCSTVGLQWLALQSVAWTTMVLSNARQVSFCEAVKRTFDGKHPCSLCHVVNKGKTSEQKRDVQIGATKIDIVCTSRAIRLLPGLAQFNHASLDPWFSEITYPPPAPPPRLA